MKLYIVYRINGGEVLDITTHRPPDGSYGTDLYRVAEINDDQCPDGCTRQPPKIWDADRKVMRNASNEDREMFAQCLEQDRVKSLRRLAKDEIATDLKFQALIAATADQLAEIASAVSENSNGKGVSVTRKSFAQRVREELED